MLVIFDGRRLRQERKRQKLPQAVLAIRAGTSIRYIRDLETGKKGRPSAERLCRLAKILDVPMDTFMVVEYDESDEVYAQNP